MQKPTEKYTAMALAGGEQITEDGLWGSLGTAHKCGNLHYVHLCVHERNS